MARLRRLARAAVRLGPRLGRAWRRSLRMRVVGVTVLLSVVMVGVLGGYLMRSVASGLLDAKVATALREAAAETRELQENFAAADVSDPRTALGLAARLLEPPAGRNEVLLLPLQPTPLLGADARRSSCPRCEVPAVLTGSVRHATRQVWTYTSMPSRGGGTVPALAVGAPVTVPGAGPYGLYHLFPLDREVQTLGLVQRTLAGAGLALVVLVGLIVFVVARQVVTPVRMAARISERLAAGRLEERMRVRGVDDLARLAASFNKMATNLQRQIRQLEDLSRLQHRFVSDVSHELRTPLATVRMAADVLYEQRGRFEPATARSAELLQAQLDRFEALLGDLLEISRFDAGAAVLEPEPVDVRTLARRVLDATEALAQHCGSTVRLTVPSTPCIAEVDSRRIERVLRNLVVNAVEHGEGRPIDVSVAGSPEAVAIAVRDHGMGLRPGEATLVFNRFWRADPARSRSTGGTGLGLSIAVEDARLHGGWLQAWGEVGDGSLFRLTLPRRVGGPLSGSPIPLEPADAIGPAPLTAVGAPYRRNGLRSASTQAGARRAARVGRGG